MNKKYYEGYCPLCGKFIFVKDNLDMHCPFCNHHLILSLIRDKGEDKHE